MSGAAPVATPYTQCSLLLPPGLSAWAASLYLSPTPENDHGLQAQAREAPSEMKLIDTLNPVPQDKRAKAADLLQRRTLLFLTASLQVHQAHWNVHGEGFGPLHELFGAVYDALDGYVDTMAERAAQLGLPVEGRAAAVAGITRDQIGTAKLLDCQDVVQTVAKLLADLSKQTYVAIDQAPDPVTQNILIDIAQGIDVWLWKVERHLESEKDD